MNFTVDWSEPIGVALLIIICFLGALILLLVARMILSLWSGYLDREDPQDEDIRPQQPLDSGLTAIRPLPERVPLPAHEETEPAAWPDDKPPF